MTYSINYLNVICLVLLYFLILLIVVSIRLYTNKPKVDITLTSINNLPDCINKLETGDLIYSSYNSFYGKVTKLVTNSIWAHIALVFDNNIVEVAVYPEEKKLEGLCIIPIEEWLKLNDNRLVAVQKGISINNNKFQKLLNNYKNIKLDLNLYNWKNVIFKKKFTKLETKTSYFCSEFIATLLKELTDLNLYWSVNSYSPIEIQKLIGTPIKVIKILDFEKMI